MYDKIFIWNSTIILRLSTDCCQCLWKLFKSCVFWPCLYCITQFKSQQFSYRLQTSQAKPLYYKHKRMWTELRHHVQHRDLALSILHSPSLVPWALEQILKKRTVFLWQVMWSSFFSPPWQWWEMQWFWWRFGRIPFREHLFTFF